MPCYRCGARQVDPVRGASPWKRGVLSDQQVLVCPDCQAVHDWMSDLDRCRACGGVHLVRRLGEVECRDCGHIASPDDPAPAHLPGPAPDTPRASEQYGAADQHGASEQDGAADQHGAAPAGDDAALADAGRLPDLSEEVASALDRVLGRTGARASVPARSG